MPAFPYRPSAILLSALLCAAAAAQPASQPGVLDPRDRASALYIVLIVSLCLVLVFVVATILILRTGRALRARQTGFERTPYVDAWGQVRVTPAELDAFRDPDSDPPPEQPEPPAPPRTDPP